jgi:hypothetical protein
MTVPAFGQARPARHLGVGQLQLASPLPKPLGEEVHGNESFPR